jgi:hypothetical protein
VSESKRSAKAVAPAPKPGFAPLFATRPRLMLATTVLLAIVAVLGMIFVGQGQLNLYQGF